MTHIQMLHMLSYVMLHTYIYIPQENGDEGVNLDLVL